MVVSTTHDAYNSSSAYVAVSGKWLAMSFKAALTVVVLTAIDLAASTPKYVIEAVLVY